MANLTWQLDYTYTMLFDYAVLFFHFFLVEFHKIFSIIIYSIDYLFFTNGFDFVFNVNTPKTCIRNTEKHQIFSIST